MSELNKNKEKNSAKPWWQDSLVLFFQLSGWIAFPIILAMILGQWLDKKYGTEPWLFLVSVGLAFVVSTFGIVKEATAALKKIDNLNKDKKDENK